MPEPQPTLAEFLLARLKEDEDVAKRAAFGWGDEWRTETDAAEEWSTVHADGKRDMVGCEDGDVTQHIARHDPARVLADIAAKRRIVERFRYHHENPARDDDREREYKNGYYGALVDIVRLWATAYAAHPAYRAEWAP